VIVLVARFPKMECSLKVTVQGKSGARIASVPLEKLYAMRVRHNRRWELVMVDMNTAYLVLKAHGR